MTMLALVFTDVAGSTRLWSAFPDAMDAVMARHHEIVHAAVAAHGGWCPADQGEGDAVFAAFDSVPEAVAASVDLQRDLAAEAWPEEIRIAVRVGVHVGDVAERGGNLFGTSVNRAARIRGLGAGGQVLLSAPAHELARDRLPEGVGIRDLGEHRMKDLTRPEQIFQLTIPELPAEFPPLASLDRAQHNLPIQSTAFIGRQTDLSELVDLLLRERCVTLVGFGGMGKTRLALQAAAELADGHGDGVWLVDVSAITDAQAVPVTICSVLGVDEGPDGALPTLRRWLRDRRLLLVLDNLEQLLPDVAATVDDLVSAGLGVHVLSTSREPLRIRAEQVIDLAPFPSPPTAPVRRTMSDADLGALSTYAAVTMFLNRAGAVRRDFTLTTANAAAVAAICVRLDGLPLALELAAARLRAYSPEMLLMRLEHSLKVLTGGSRDLPARQQTMSATIRWSCDALDPDSRTLLGRLGVFPDTFTLDAAEAICAGDEQLEVFDLLEVLVDRSLVRRLEDQTRSGSERFRLLVPIREFAQSDLTGSEEWEAMRDRHADFFSAAVALPTDWTLEDEQGKRYLMSTDWSNIRFAGERLSETGRWEALAEVVWYLSAAGSREPDHRSRLGAWTATLLDRLAGSDHLAAEVRLRLVRFDQHVGRREVAGAQASGRHAVSSGRRLGEPSLLAAALSELAFVTVGEEGEGSVAEAQDILRLLPDHGNALPSWRVQDRVWQAVGSPERVDQSAAGQARDALLRSADAASQQVARNLEAVALFQAGSHRQVVELLAGQDLSGYEPHLAIMELTLTGTSHLLLGGFDEARRNFEAARARAAVLGLGPHEGQLDCHLASLDRMDGDSEGAAERLMQLIRSNDEAGESAAYAHWLLAVLSREGGLAREASQHLAAAWRLGHLDEWNLDLVLQCMLERAEQVVAERPADAVRLVSLVEQHRDGEPFYHGVDYDTDSILCRAEVALGAHRVAEVKQNSRGQPLPREESWDT